MKISFIYNDRKYYLDWLDENTLTCREVFENRNYIADNVYKFKNYDDLFNNSDKN